MILITESENKGHYTLTSDKGKTIEVSFSMGSVWVRVRNASARAWGNAMGRKFSTLADAVDHYKNEDVKHALRSLISELV